MNEVQGQLINFSDEELASSKDVPAPEIPKYTEGKSLRRCSKCRRRTFSTDTCYFCWAREVRKIRRKSECGGEPRGRDR